MLAILLCVTSPQKQVTDVSLVLKDSDMDSENLSSLIRLSVSDGQKTGSSKVVSVIRVVYNKICKPLVVYRFTGNVITSIATLRT